MNSSAVSSNATTDHHDHDVTLERTISAMSNNNPLLHPVHFHSFRSATTTFGAFFFRQCVGCQERLTSSSIVQCAACGVMAHRSCGLLKQETAAKNRLFDPNFACKVNCQTASKDDIEQRAREQDDVGYVWDENEDQALAMEGAGAEGTAAMIDNDSHHSSGSAAKQRKSTRRLRLRKLRRNEDTNDSGDEDDQDSTGNNTLYQLDDQGIPVMVDRLQAPPQSSSFGRDLLESSRYSHNQLPRNSMTDAMILSRSSQSWSLSDDLIDDDEREQSSSSSRSITSLFRRHRSKSERRRDNDSSFEDDELPHESSSKPSSFRKRWKKPTKTAESNENNKIQDNEERMKEDKPNRKKESHSLSADRFQEAKTEENATNPLEKEDKEHEKEVVDDEQIKEKGEEGDSSRKLEDEHVQKDSSQQNTDTEVGKDAGDHENEAAPQNETNEEEMTSISLFSLASLGNTGSLTWRMMRSASSSEEGKVDEDSYLSSFLGWKSPTENGDKVEHSSRVPRPVFSWKSALGLASPEMADDVVVEPSESANNEENNNPPTEIDMEEYSALFVWTADGPPKHWAWWTGDDACPVE